MRNHRRELVGPDRHFMTCDDGHSRQRSDREKPTEHELYGTGLLKGGDCRDVGPRQRRLPWGVNVISDQLPRESIPR